MKSIRYISILGLILATLVACDSNVMTSDSTNPNVTDPDNDVAQNVGPVEKNVTTDVLNKSTAIRGDISALKAPISLKT